MRAETWSNPRDIMLSLAETDDPRCGAGPLLYRDKGRYFCDVTESHFETIGRTGEGKTECVVLPFARSVIDKKESLFAIDPKGDILLRIGSVLPKDCQTFVIDFRCPAKSPHHWNPLTYPYRLFRSADPDDRDIAAETVTTLFDGLFPDNPNVSDPFWNQAGRSLAIALTYSLFRYAKSEEDVNLNSVAYMVEHIDEKLSSLPGPALRFIDVLYSSLPKNSMARRSMAAYVSAPVNETRPSIQAVTAAGLQLFGRSDGLASLLGEDTVYFPDIDLSKQFAIFVVLPDASDVYSPICGIFVQMFSRHLIREADKAGGRLPRRVNMIIEELGSIGSAIEQLPNLCVAGRSRNIRLCLVLQSAPQLNTIYGETRSETIRSSKGISVNFSSNNLRTLTELSERMGVTLTYDENGKQVREPLITPSHLAAMPKFNAVITTKQLKYITKLPLYSEIYANEPERPPRSFGRQTFKEPVLFDFEGTIKMIRENRVNEILTLITSDIKRGVEALDPPPAPEAPPKKKPAGEKTPPKKFIVNVSVCPDSDEKRRNNVSELVAAAMDISPQAATDKLRSSRPIQITFDEEAETLFFSKLVLASGGVPSIREE